jgi:superfamily II RNA helicase
MSVNHHELRSAFGRYLAAKRALRQAYQESRASHGRAESISNLESAAARRLGNDSLLIEEVEELKIENQRLRKSLALLHTYSLRVQEQRDTLVAQRETMLEVSEAVASCMRDDDRSDDYFIVVLEQLDDVIGELSNSVSSYV